MLNEELLHVFHGDGTEYRYQVPSVFLFAQGRAPAVDWLGKFSLVLLAIQGNEIC